MMLTIFSGTPYDAVKSFVEINKRYLYISWNLLKLDIACTYYNYAYGKMVFNTEHFQAENSSCNWRFQTLSYFDLNCYITSIWVTFTFGLAFQYHCFHISTIVIYLNFTWKCSIFQLFWLLTSRQKCLPNLGYLCLCPMLLPTCWPFYCFQNSTQYLMSHCGVPSK